MSRHTTPPDNHNTPGREPGPEQWVPEAIAQQEEYLNRVRSCMGQLGRGHTFRAHGTPEAGLISTTWEQCIVCGVTETDADYQTRLRANSQHPE